MPRKSGLQKKMDASPYRRGDFWLDRHRGSENWYIFWYNSEKRQYEYKSTKVSDVEDAAYRLDRHFLQESDCSDTYCGYCGSKVADGSLYTLIMAINDYLIEVAEKRVSREAIASRLSHVVRFIDEHLKAPKLPCSKATDDRFVDRFRDWLQPQPIQWRNGSGVVTTTALRTRSSVEESVHQLRAVLNHAVRRGRSDVKPVFQAHSRQVVSAPVRARANLDLLAEMVDYASEYEKRSSLHRFIVASLCTAARPDSVYDMNVNAGRYQWQKEQSLFDLNPWGRVQTKKYRPIVPVVPLLQKLLEETEATSPDGWVVHYLGNPVWNVRSAWRTMIADLNLDGGREWGTYLLRRSVASILRNSGASAWDLQGLLGHRTAGMTEIYAYSTYAPTARLGIENLLEEIESRVPGKLQGNRWGK